MSEPSTHGGGCLCGAVRYRVQGPMREVIACHCSQCRRTSGHYAAMTSVREDRLTLEGMDTLVWYRSSEAAERGFCARCGGNLFWRQFGTGLISITAGSLDAPTHLEVTEHIFVADKSDYYEIQDGKPQKAAW